MGGIPGREQPPQTGDELTEAGAGVNQAPARERHSGKIGQQVGYDSLHIYLQTSTNNSVSDNQKEERIAMEKKLSEMEEKLKVKSKELSYFDKYFDIYFSASYDDG